MPKSALPASQIRAAVEARLGPVGELEPLPEGMVSQAFAFRRGDESFVVRVGADRADYEKDAFVARAFGRRGLPVPEVLAIEEVGEGLALCVSRRAPGAPISALDGAAARSAEPAVLEALAEIGRADIAAVTGWGRFDASGRARWPTWRAYLRRYHADVDWIGRLSPDDAATVRQTFRLVERLAPAGEFERRLIHGDFGAGNLIADGPAVSAVIDWSFAAVGDVLYDVANLLFWDEARLAAVCETLRRREAAQTRTLLCYQLRIGIEELRRTVTGRIGGFDLEWLLARVRALLDAARS